jgi:hypothetical protein
LLHFLSDLENELDTGAAQWSSLRLLNFREYRCMKSHSSLHGIKETLSLIVTFLIRFGKRTRHRSCPMNVIAASEFSWKSVHEKPQFTPRHKLNLALNSYIYYPVWKRKWMEMSKEPHCYFWVLVKIGAWKAIILLLAEINPNYLKLLRHAESKERLSASVFYVTEHTVYSFVTQPFLCARFKLFCFNASCQFTSHLNLRSLIFGLTPFGWLRSSTLNPYLWWNYNFFLFMPYLFSPSFSGTQLSHTTRGACIHLLYYSFFNFVVLPLLCTFPLRSHVSFLIPLLV